MAQRILELHPAAVDEAAEAHDWYFERSPRAAAAFMAELDTAIDQIALFPERWAVGGHGTRRYPLKRFPYLVIYHLRSDKIRIVAVAHARRRPGYWKKRTRE